MGDSNGKTALYALIAVLAGFAVLVWAAIRLFRKPNGVFEQGESTDTTQTPTNNGNDMTYSDMRIQMQHFNIGEFDSPDVPGSGNKMHISTLGMLDKARTKAGFAFKINSGYRSESHNAAVGGVSNSAHRYGYAADISATTEAKQIAVLKALYAVGFRRFGVYDTFIHADNDPSKPSPTLWREGGTNYNPIT